jgi:hypothetical protein
MDKTEYTKLMVCLVVMLAGISVPYTGTCLMSLAFCIIVNFDRLSISLAEMVIKIENKDRHSDEEESNGNHS